jgi:hypothetical protein
MAVNEEVAAEMVWFRSFGSVLRVLAFFEFL